MNYKIAGLRIEIVVALSFSPKSVLKKFVALKTIRWGKD